MTFDEAEKEGVMLIDKQIIAEICGHRCIYSFEKLCPDCFGKRAMQDITDICWLLDPKAMNELAERRRENG